MDPVVLQRTKQLLRCFAAAEESVQLLGIDNAHAVDQMPVLLCTLRRWELVLLAAVENVDVLLLFAAGGYILGGCRPQLSTKDRGWRGPLVRGRRSVGRHPAAPARQRAAGVDGAQSMGNSLVWSGGSRRCAVGIRLPFIHWLWVLHWWCLLRVPQ